jgi:hypothetical protein
MSGTVAFVAGRGEVGAVVGQDSVDLVGNGFVKGDSVVDKHDG